MEQSIEGITTHANNPEGLRIHIYIIVEALMHGECQQPPIFTTDKIGRLAKKTWKEQELIGWMHVAQGRLSKTWGEAQGVYYEMNPELRSKKYLSPLNWTKVMIGALIDMSLTMWKNRCGSLYGRSEAEKVQKQRNKLRKQIEQCFLNYHQIPEKHHYLF